VAGSEASEWNNHFGNTIDFYYCRCTLALSGDKSVVKTVVKSVVKSVITLWIELVALIEKPPAKAGIQVIGACLAGFFKGF